MCFELFETQHSVDSSEVFEFKLGLSCITYKIFIGAHFVFNCISFAVSRKFRYGTRIFYRILINISILRLCLECVLNTYKMYVVHFSILQRKNTHSIISHEFDTKSDFIRTVVVTVKCSCLHRYYSNTDYRIIKCYYCRLTSKIRAIQ